MKNCIYSLLFACSMSFAYPANELKSDFQEQLDAIYAVIEKDHDDIEGIFALAKDDFDFALMGKLAMGGELYSKLSSDQIARYQDAFVNKMLKDLAIRLKNYSNQKVVINEASSDEKRCKATTSINYEGEKKDLVFLMRRQGPDCFIYNVEIAGVNLMQTYKSQIADLFANKSFEEALSKIK